MSEKKSVRRAAPVTRRDPVFERTAGAAGFTHYFASLSDEDQDACLRDRGELGDNWSCRRRLRARAAQAALGT